MHRVFFLVAIQGAPTLPRTMEPCLSNDTPVPEILSPSGESEAHGVQKQTLRRWYILLGTIISHSKALLKMIFHDFPVPMVGQVNFLLGGYFPKISPTEFS